MKRAAFIIMIGWMAVGCASMGNTVAQDMTWEAGRICNSRYPTVQMERVDPDGRYWWKGQYAGDKAIPDFQTCVTAERERIRAAK